jgi:hypothetical protein
VAEIYLPGEKEKIWHRMRDDLKSLVPWFADYDLLLCPTCLRHITFEEFSLEHIIPQQALAEDHLTARGAVACNQRAGLTLLCSKPLIIREKLVRGNGCNSWKGKYFDRFIRQVLQAQPDKITFTLRHQISMFILGYLALFRRYGYRISLSRSGLLMRSQFFTPNDFLKSVPIKCQMILGGQPLSEFDEQIKSYWDEPFKITIHEGFALVGVRSVVFWLPLSDDPTAPIARVLRYAPPRYKIRPDFTTVF